MKSTNGKLASLLDHWSVYRLKEAGADCVKALMYYPPFADASVNEQKSVRAERVGAECRALDIAFFLELLNQSGVTAIDEVRFEPRLLTQDPAGDFEGAKRTALELAHTHGRI